MKSSRESTITLTMTENEASKVLMMLNEISSIKHESYIPEWAHKTSLEMISALEKSGVES